MQLMQHKREAYWFYSYLSQFYDKLVNPLFWTEPMREQSLHLADLDEANPLTVIDVGSGTGFTTQGIVQFIPPEQVTCVDQSPHQMAKAKKKPDLQGCHFLLGDAENLPVPDHSFDRYVSAGSIEYWPQPDKGIREAFRVIKAGGKALLVGPLKPKNPLGRFFADAWMLFPEETEYRKWYEEAGFQDIQIEYIRPHWFKGNHEYGLAIVGTKPKQSTGTQQAPPLVELEAEPKKVTLADRFRFIWRVLIGSLAGFVFIPTALWGYLMAFLRGDPDRQPLTREQSVVLTLLGILLLIILLNLIF